MRGPLVKATIMLVAVLLLPFAVVQWGFAQETGPGFSVAVLASNRAGLADTTDSLLRDPWGLTAMRTGPWWIANGGSGSLRTYSGSGLPVPGLRPLSVAIPAAPGEPGQYAAPAGVAFNESAGFALGPSEPAWFLIATRNGQIDGWFPGGETAGAAILSDQSPDAGLTGAAISGERLYVANFRQKRVDVYDGDLSPLDLGPNAFEDPSMQSGLSPYNVQEAGGRIIVAYAAPDGDGRYAVPGAGHVAVFDGNGRLLLQLQPGPWMNAPWGITVAPDTFGLTGNAILVANSGSGRIAVFDPRSGAFLGYLRDLRGQPIEIRGLHGLGFGNNDLAGPSATLYFTAGPDGGRTGIFGSVVRGPLFP